MMDPANFSADEKTRGKQGEIPSSHQPRKDKEWKFFNKRLLMKLSMYLKP